MTISPVQIKYSKPKYNKNMNFHSTLIFGQNNKKEYCNVSDWLSLLQE